MNNYTARPINQDDSLSQVNGRLINSKSKSEYLDLDMNHSQSQILDRSGVFDHDKTNHSISEDHVILTPKVEMNNKRSKTSLKDKGQVQKALVKNLLESKLQQSTNKELFMESRIGKVIRDCFMIETVRRQKLVYGCLDINERLKLINQFDQLEDPTNQEKQEEQGIRKKQFYEYLLIKPTARWIIIFDGYMAIVNFWACVYSAWITVFKVEDATWANTLDIIVLVSFTLDILFTMARQYRDVHGILVTSHRLIFLKYLQSGWFFIDVISTFPFNYID